MTAPTLRCPRCGRTAPAPVIAGSVVECRGEWPQRHHATVRMVAVEVSGEKEAAQP